MKKATTRNPYPLLIIGLLAFFIIFLIWSARQAATRGSRISDPEYYSKGLKYNNTELEIRTASTRGWQLQTALNGHQLSFQLHDGKGQPISKAKGELIVFLAQSKRILNLPTMENQPGSYRLDLPADIMGSLQAHIEFEKQGARISRQLLLNL